MDLPLPMFLHFMFMAVALMCFYTAFFIVRKKRNLKWMKRHRFAATSGVITAIAGFIAMFVNKVINSYPQFASIHALGGLAALIITSTALILGNLILKGKKVRPMHKFFGRTGIIIIIITAIFGVLMLALS